MFERELALVLFLCVFSVDAQILPFRVYTHHDGLPSDQITAIFQDSKGFLWIGTPEGVSIFDGKIFANYSIKDGLGIGQVNHIIESRNRPGTMYLALAGGGVTTYARGTFSTMTIDTSFISNYVTNLVEDSLGSLWCLTSAGLYRLDMTGRILMASKYGEKFFDLADSIVLSATRRHIRIPDPLFEDPEWNLENVSGMPKRGIACSFVDKEEVLWIGTEWEGLWKLTNRSLVSFPITRTPPGYYNYSPAVADRNWHFWAISGDGVWEYWKQEKHGWYSYLHPQTTRSRHGQLIGVTTDSTGLLWLVYTEGWLMGYRLDAKENAHSHLDLEHEFSPLLPNERQTKVDPLAYTFDKAGHLLYALPNGGIREFSLDPSPKLIRTYGKSEGVDIGSFFALTSDKNGNIWGGSFSQGVLCLGPDRVVRYYTKQDGLPELSIRSLFVNANGQLWVGTRRGGIALLRDGKFESISVLDGLISNSIWSLAGDDSGRIWAATSVGLQAIEGKTVRVLPAKTELTGYWTGKCGVTARSELWWHEDGVAFRIFDYGKDTRNLVAPPVYISGVTVNGREETLEGIPEVSFDRNNWMVRFVAPGMKDPDGMRYRYKLNESEAEWSHDISERSVTFGALAPGEYVFMVEAVNSDGIHSKQPARYHFVIKPPFWKTSWFLGIAFIMTCFVLYGTYRYRIKKLVAMERLRTTIATDLHDDIGTSLTRIALYADASLREIENNGMAHPTNTPTGVKEWLRDIGVTSRGLVDAMNDIVWAVDPKHDSFESVLIRMKTLAARMFDAKGIDYGINISDNLGSVYLSLQERRQFFLVFKESVNNIIKHARATRVDLSIHRSGSTLHFDLRDNGVGFGIPSPGQGSGLRNMRERAMALGGGCEISSEPGGGTHLHFTMNIP